MDVGEVRSTWDGVADAWQRYEPQLTAFTAPVRRSLLGALELAPDAVVLELAAGTGGLSRELAPHVGEVRCTDLAPRMVAAAQQRARAAGLDNVRCQVVDAHALPDQDASVDAVVCQLGLMLLPDPDAALRELARVLRPGGHAAVATWGPPQDNPWVLLLGASLLQHGHAVPGDPLGPGGVFSLSDPTELGERFRAAGFRDVRSDQVRVALSCPSFEAYWELQCATAGPLRELVDGLGQQELATVRATCHAACEGFRDGDGYRFGGLALVTSARR